MLVFALRRILSLVPVLIAVSIIVFVLLRLIPGDPARLMAGEDASKSDIEAIRRSFGFDRPLHIQYMRFVVKGLSGDLGRSTRTFRPVAVELASRIPYSLQLALTAMFGAIVLGIISGIAAAVWHGSALDTILMVQAVAGISIPIFLLGLLLMLLFASVLGWFPSSGAGTPRHLILPALTLALAQSATIARLTRSTMLDVLFEDYVRTARAKGLSERAVIVKHALRNAAIPLVTIVGLDFGRLLGGAVITETVFAWPGMGYMIVEAVRFRDYPILQAAIVFFAAVVILTNLLVDLSYGFLDPRVRYDHS